MSVAFQSTPTTNRFLSWHNGTNFVTILRSEDKQAVFSFQLVNVVSKEAGKELLLAHIIRTLVYNLLSLNEFC